MSKPAHQTGYTIVELCVMLAVIFGLAAIVIPIYIDYNDGVKMSKANQHYSQAIRLAQQTLVQRTDVEDGDSQISEQEWILLFGGQEVAAPGGGPAFVEGIWGDPDTGAIGVEADFEFIDLAIVRPAYLDLVPYKAEIRGSKVVYSKI